MIRKVVFVAVLGSFLTHCGKEESQGTNCEQATFAQIEAEILKVPAANANDRAKCQFCHTTTKADAQKKSDPYDTHAQVSAAATSMLSRMKAGTMPLTGKLPDATIAIFENWINCGKKQ